MRRPIADSSTPIAQPHASRRGFFFGAAAVGAATGAVLALPKLVVEADDASVAPVASPPPERGGGYQLSDHVKQYYRTTRT